MPELPEVEGLVRELAPEAIGRVIEEVSISPIVIDSKERGREAIIKGMSTEQFKQEMKGLLIADVIRRSKYIYFHVEKDGEKRLLISHLGMTGAWFAVNRVEDVFEEKFRKHIHVVLKMKDGGLLVYSDIRRFGELRLLNLEADHPPLLKMAPEPFEEEAMDYFLACTMKPKYENKPIKEVIMDGQVISGCGNIYATEALFKMKIHPNRATNRISEARKKELFVVIVEILQESIDAGGSTISDYRNLSGESGTMQDRLQMYGQKQCPHCESETKRMQIGGRTSVYCPKCQR